MTARTALDKYLYKFDASMYHYWGLCFNDNIFLPPFLMFMGRTRPPSRSFCRTAIYYFLKVPEKYQILVQAISKHLLGWSEPYLWNLIHCRGMPKGSVNWPLNFSSNCLPDRKFCPFFNILKIYSAEISRTAIGMNICFLQLTDKRVFVWVRIFNFDRNTGLNYRFLKEISVS